MFCVSQMLGHEFTEQPCQMKFVPEFECNEQMIQWWLVAEQGMGTVETGWVLLALPADVACAGRQGNGATCAGMLVEGQFLLAGVAQVEFVMSACPTEQAMPGQVERLYVFRPIVDFFDPFHLTVYP